MKIVVEVKPCDDDESEDIDPKAVPLFRIIMTALYHTLNTVDGLREVIEQNRELPVLRIDLTNKGRPIEGFVEVTHE